RVHRSVHSFPTRRSSDLVRDGTAHLLCGHRPAVGTVAWKRSGDDVTGEHVARRGQLAAGALVVLVRAGVAEAADREAELGHQPVDRKSTRLNSSHDQSSY